MRCDAMHPEVKGLMKQLDLNGNGTIERLEYYEMAKQINTEDPIWGLLLILLLVIFCTIMSALTLRGKK